MTKYVAIPETSWASDWDYVSDRPTCQVWPEDDTPIRTGLLDANGTPLYRLRDRVPLGFRRE